LFRAVASAARLVLLVSPGWFGHIRYATPIVHTDDHRDLAHQAVRHLIKGKAVARDSQLAMHARDIEEGCGMLDLVESDTGKKPGKLEWEYSHMYDPIAGRGIDDRRTVNALDEFTDWWERALVHVKIGNSGKAYTFLGYCCHLLQDMAVPSHTHCVSHGLRTRIADNLELVSSSRRFHLREPAGPPYRGDDDMHVALFVAMALESRGRDTLDPGEPNEIAEVLKKYYGGPRWTSDGWKGSYRGDPYYPYHRFLPSSPRIELADLVTLRNQLMCSAAERTSQLVMHFADVTGAGDRVLSVQPHRPRARHPGRHGGRAGRHLRDRAR
jgi:hypothetical protein